MASQWFIKKGMDKVGPFSSAELREIVSKGQLTSHDLVQKECMSEWVEAKRLKNLFPEDKSVKTDQTIIRTDQTVFYDSSQIKSVNKDQSINDLDTFAGNFKKEKSESLGGLNTYFGNTGRPGAESNNGDEDIDFVLLSDRYTTEKVLGQGGMGEVVLAFDKRLQRHVAIKRIKAEHVTSKSAIRRFMTEAQSIAKVNHSNIVQIFEYGQEATGPFLILEYIDGGSLHDLIKQEIIKPELAISIVSQILDGLTKAHAVGIIHRDIKPANILMTKDRLPKLTDFGLAKLEMDYSPNTVSGSILGTIDFMAPEQRKDAALTDERSDLWSVGATFYQMITGENPRVIDMDLVPVILKPIISKSLKSQKGERYQSAKDFKAALDSLKELIQSNKAEMKVLMKSIKTSLKKEYSEQLLIDLNRALEIDPDNSDMLVLRQQVKEKLFTQSPEDGIEELTDELDYANTNGSVRTGFYMSGILITAILSSVFLYVKSDNSRKELHVQSSFDTNNRKSLDTSPSSISVLNNTSLPNNNSETHMSRDILPKDLLLPGDSIKNITSDIDMAKFDIKDINELPDNMSLLKDLRTACIETYCNYLVRYGKPERSDYITFANPVLKSLFESVQRSATQEGVVDRVSILKNTNLFELIYFSKDLKRAVFNVRGSAENKWYFEFESSRYKINYLYNNAMPLNLSDYSWGRIPRSTKDLKYGEFKLNPQQFNRKRVAFYNYDLAYIDTKTDFSKITGKPSKLYVNGVLSPTAILADDPRIIQVLDDYIKKKDDDRDYFDLYRINVSGVIHPYSSFFSKSELPNNMNQRESYAYFMIVDDIELLDLSERRKPYIERLLTPNDLQQK